MASNDFSTPPPRMIRALLSGISSLDFSRRTWTEKAATLLRRSYLLGVLLPLPFALLHLAALLLLPLLLLPLTHCRKRNRLSPPLPRATEPQRAGGLTFLLQLVVVQQQADHLFGFERVGFEVASGDHHPLDLVTEQTESVHRLLTECAFAAKRVRGRCRACPRPRSSPWPSAGSSPRWCPGR